MNKTDTVLHCSEDVPDRGSGFYRTHKCGRPIFADSKCKIHCSAAKAVRAMKSQEKYKENVNKELRYHLMSVINGIRAGKFSQIELEGLREILHV